jgi:hypothetical protein
MQIKLNEIAPIPPRDNPLLHNQESIMYVASGVYVQSTAHPDSKTAQFIVVDKNTGRRYEITIGDAVVIKMPDKKYLPPQSSMMGQTTKPPEAPKKETVVKDGIVKVDLPVGVKHQPVKVNAPVTPPTKTLTVPGSVPSVTPSPSPKPFSPSLSIKK